jgi:hypothetical protein
MPLRPSRLLLATLAASLACFALAGCASASSSKLPKNAGANGTVAHSSSAVVAPKLLDLTHLDACTLLPQADAETLVAAKMLKPIKTMNAGLATCTYPTETSGATAQVEIYVGDGAKQQLSIDKDKIHHKFTQPTGLGDEAWQEDDWIFARKGATWVSIGIVRLEDPSLFVKPLQSAMAELLSKLPAA